MNILKSIKKIARHLRVSSDDLERLKMTLDENSRDEDYSAWRKYLQLCYRSNEIPNMYYIWLENYFSIDIARNMKEWSLQSINLPHLKWVVGLREFQLKRLFLYDNQIRSIEGLEDFTAPNLEVLDLGINRLPNIYDAAIWNFPKLRDLRLNKNQLKDVQGLKGTEYPALYNLDLQGNQITSLEGLDKLTAPSLYSLDLSYNSLRSLDELFELDAPFLMMLRVNDNAEDFSSYESDLKKKFPLLRPTF